MKLTTINTGLFKLDGGAMFGVVPKSMWSKRYAADENNMCTWAMRCLLIEEGNQLILVDTGIGEKFDSKFASHFYLHGDDSLIKSIKQAGYDTKDITDVFLTHLHFDHCGGAIIKDGEIFKPQFTQAHYWSNDAHWQNATKPNERERASFLPTNILPIEESGQLKMFSNNSTSIINANIEVIVVDGHSEGMMLPLITYKNRKILFAADLFPSPHHIALPWIMGYDMQPLKTLAEKKAILERAVTEDWLIYFEHDAQVEMCNLVKTDKGIAVKDILQLSDV
jgi:glyoxylase-like metal-dependent hydrolase (beta-lactamase superfamily II)